MKPHTEQLVREARGTERRLRGESSRVEELTIEEERALAKYLRELAMKVLGYVAVQQQAHSKRACDAASLTKNREKPAQYHKSTTHTLTKQICAALLLTSSYTFRPIRHFMVNKRCF